MADASAESVTAGHLGSIYRAAGGAWPMIKKINKRHQRRGKGVHLLLLSLLKIRRTD